MGNSTSATAADSVVPMTPTALAITQLWSSVWDMPRFQGSRPRLSLDVVRPLLSIAGSCVAVLLVHVGAHLSESELPACGVSADLLEAALAGDTSAAALLDPVAEPLRFIRALVQATFRSGDGKYLYGVTEPRLDELLEEYCHSQLHAAAFLRSDPSAVLKDSLKAAIDEIEQVIETPPRHDDLMGVANRLLLKQQLDCLTKDAAAINSQKASKILVESAGAPDKGMQEAKEDAMEKLRSIDRLMASADGEDWEHLEDARIAESDAEGNAPEGAEVAPSKTVVSGSTSPASEADATSQNSSASDCSEAERDAPPERTKSQMVKSMKVEKVKGKLDTLRGPVYDLRRATSALTRKGATEEDRQAEDEDLEQLRAELTAIDVAEKRARNFGEDLIEDMLTLDNLENLAPEDRLSRKAAYAGLESLLEDVDVAKGRLKPLRQSLEKRLKQMEEKVHERERRRKIEEEAEEKKKNVSEAQAKAGAKRKVASMSTALEKVMPEVPSREAWRQVRLPLHFHSKEGVDHYTVVAAIPNFDLSELQASLSEDMTTLVVKGLRAPSMEEVAVMQQTLLSHLQLLAKQSPGHLKEFVKQVGPETYFELGEGKYGQFSQSLRLPEDVDVEKINVGYEDGYLQIKLPKMRTETRRPQTARGLGAFDWPAGGMSSRLQRPRSEMYRSAPRVPGYFGGIDDVFRW